MEENKDLFPGETPLENNPASQPEIILPVESNQIAAEPAEPEIKPDFSNNDSEKPGAGSAITVVIIIVLVALGVWYFNRNENKAETNSENGNVNITVDDSREQGEVRILDQNAAASTTVKITAYYSNTKRDPGLPDCSRVYPLEREVERKYEQKEINTARGLLTPLTQKEKAAGWVSSIPDGTTLKNIRINGNSAIVNFGSTLSKAAGSCAVTAIRSQVEKTMKQFKYIKVVVICVEGNCQPDEILQP